MIPVGPIKQYAAESVAAPMTLLAFPGVDGASTWYEDDGRSFDYRKGEFMKVEMAWRNSDRRLRLALAKGSRMLPPASRTIEVRVAGEQKLTSVKFDGKPIEVRA